MAGGFIDADLQGLFSTNEFAVSATFGAITKPVIFDETGSEALQEMATTEPSIRYITADFPGLNAGSQIVMGIQTWSVVQSIPLDDGLTSIATIGRIS